jgi:hypothetical protein
MRLFRKAADFAAMEQVLEEATPLRVPCWDNIRPS